MTLVEREGRALSFHITHIDHTNIRAALVTNAHRSSTLMTDDARFYLGIGSEFAKHGTTSTATANLRVPAASTATPLRTFSLS